MRDCTFKGQRGASILEVIIVLVIVGIMVTFAIISLKGAPDNLSRQNVARQFKVYLERARFDSIKRRTNVCSDMSRVSILDSKSFSLTIDSNQNGRLDVPDETQVITVSNPRDMQIVGSALTLPVTIRFDERGHALLTDCVTDAPANVPLFYFCNGPCTSLTANPQNSNVIFLSATGTVAMLPGGVNAPTFATPAVSNVASNTVVNPLVSVWDPSTATPSPTPSPGHPLRRYKWIAPTHHPCGPPTPDAIAAPLCGCVPTGTADSSIFI